MFHPGETVTHKFVIPFAISELKTVVVSYKQGDHIVLEKEIPSANWKKLDGKITSVSLTLSQKESLAFGDPDYTGCLSSESMPFNIQLNVITLGGTRHTSNPVKDSSGIQYLRVVK